MEKALATRKYRVTLDGDVYEQRVELHKSEAFHYGNGTMVAHYDGVNGQPLVYDTRYEIGIVKNFNEWADNYMKNWCNPKCVIEVIE